MLVIACKIIIYILTCPIIIARLVFTSCLTYQRGFDRDYEKTPSVLYVLIQALYVPDYMIVGLGEPVVSVFGNRKGVLNVVPSWCIGALSSHIRELHTNDHARLEFGFLTSRDRNIVLCLRF